MGELGAADARRVLVFVEDDALAELLDEALTTAGHDARLALTHDADRLVADGGFDVAIVDLDTRARDGARLAARLRRAEPRITVVALLPCGGLPPSAAPVPYHLAVEKPARLAAVLSAVSASHKVAARVTPVDAGGRA
jgi:CheY-like chemotaxis protein